MTTRITATVFVLAFGWAFVETGRMASMIDRFRRSPARSSHRLIEVLEETPEFRRIKHPLGETRVPLEPKRIACLTSSAADSLIALGVKPVLVTTSWRNDRVTPYLADQLADVPKVRLGETIDIETVLAANPDLILAGTARDGRLYRQLSKIAPTVCIASETSGDREMRVLDVGDVVGRSEQARRRLEEYHRRLAQARATIAARAHAQPVSFLRFRRNTCIIYTRSAMFGPLLFEQLALTPDPAMPEVMSGGGWDVLSVERLSMLQSEYIFLVVDRDSEVYFDRVTDTPIWQNIPAVKHGHVRHVAAGTWLSGDGVLGCEAIVDDVLAAIAP